MPLIQRQKYVYTNYEILDYGNADLPKSLFKTVYPYLNLGLDLGLLGHDIAYLFEKTDSYRPWHRWLGVRVERRAEPVSP